MLKKYSKIVLAILGIILSSYLICQTDLKSLFQSFQKTIDFIPSIVILISFTSYIGSILLRGVRYGLMIGRSLSIRTIIKSVFVGYAGNNILPARLGELLRTQYLYEKLSLSRIDTLLTIFAEKILDLFIILSLLFLVLSQFWSNHSTLLIILAFATIAFLVYGRPIFSAVTIELGRLFPTNKYVSPFIKSVQNVSLNLGSSANFTKIIILSLLIWLLEWLVFWIIINQLSITEHAFIGSVMVLVFVNLSILIPSAPGYIGVFQAAFTYSISLIESGDSERALVAAVIVHVIQYSSTSLYGGLIILINRKEFLKISRK